MRATAVLTIWAASHGPRGCGADLVVDRTHTAHTFDGIGGLSGGGATSRLLVDYVEPQRSEILDYLFKPNYGASLQMLKVEIAGDSQSGCGTESSHMHDNHTVDLDTGYEWWLMKEAKARNPNIKFYGLPWAYPGWVGNDPQTGEHNPSATPFTHPEQTSRYVMEWVKGAKTHHDLDIDYIGIWNERDSDKNYALSLRRTLNEAGFNNTKIVAKDGGVDICYSMAADPEYAKTVDIIGFHYPQDFPEDAYDICRSLGKPIWSSEESSSYDDLNGAACWGRVINSHYALQNMTASIMWNLVGAYYHGTDWYASSMMTAVQPWSGHYEVNPVIWATAHLTQFTEIGWLYLPNGSGSGTLPQGGYYTSLVDPNSDNFTMNIVKISHEHARCTRYPLPSFNVSDETVTFRVAASMNAPESLHVWYSNYNTDKNGAHATLFEKLPNVKVVNGSFSLKIPVGAHFTISTIGTATKPTQPSIPPSSPSFPLPHVDDFQVNNVSQEAPFLADQIGAFEVHMDGSTGNKLMRQMVPQLPIGWADPGTYGPVTVIGMKEWQDVSVSVDVRIPSSAPSSSAACVATRVDKMWANGIVFCVSTEGAWNLTVGGPKLGGTVSPENKIAHGSVSLPHRFANWATIELTTVGATAMAAINGKLVIKGQAIRDLDTGFAAFGASDWFAAEYDNLKLDKAGPFWSPTSPCPAASAGDSLYARDCSRNGIVVADLQWELESNWQLRHVDSGLCASAESAADGAAVLLRKCESSNELQKFYNDYTLIRQQPLPMTLHGHNLALAGDINGKVFVTNPGAMHVDWQQWVFFPNTGQLRNQIITNTTLGYPKCLNTCATSNSRSSSTLWV